MWTAVGEATGLGVPPEVGDVDRRRLDRHEVEGRRPPAARALAERPRGRDHDPTPEQLRALLVVVPAQHDLCPRGHDATLRLAPAGEAHTLRDIAPQHVVMQHQHPGLLPRRRFEQPAHPCELALREVPLHREIAHPRRERAPRHAVRSEGARDDGPGERQRGRQVRAEVARVLRVQRLLRKRDQRSYPPRHVVVAGDHEDRRGAGRGLHECPRPLELPMARPLRQVARDHDRVGPQVGEHLLEALDLIGVGEAAEMEVREVEQLDGHDSAWTV